MHEIQHLSTADWLGLFVFFSGWIGYAWFSERSRWASRGLIHRSHDFRLIWAYRMLEREVRVTDSTLIGNLVNSVSFYANTTIYILAGLLAALGAADKLSNFAADFSLVVAGNREMLEIKLLLVLSCFVFAYFKFTWSLRQFNLLSILVGAAPTGGREDPSVARYAKRLAGINNLAGDDFNRGIRAYYFGLAASGWLFNPLLLGVLAVAILLVLHRRDYRSTALDLLRGEI